MNDEQSVSFDALTITDRAKWGCVAGEVLRGGQELRRHLDERAKPPVASTESTLTELFRQLTDQLRAQEVRRLTTVAKLPCERD